MGAFGVMLDGERNGRFAVEVEDVGQDRGGSFTFSRPGGSAFSASRWISVSPRAFRSKPDRTQPVEFRVRVPRFAEPGDHVASLTVKRIAAPRPGRVAVVEALAVRLTVRVKGRLRPAAELRDLRVLGTAGGGPISGAVTVVNTGNVRLDFDGRDRGSLAVMAGARPRERLPFRGVLYPGQEREFRLAWVDPPSLGHFEMRARLQTRRGAVRASNTFWIVPWRQTVAVLLVSTAAVVYAAGRRRYRRFPE